MKTIDVRPLKRNSVLSSVPRLLCAAMIALGVTACHPDDDGSATAETTLKVAVIMEAGEQERWEQTAAWAMQNIADAQRGMASSVKFELTFKSQNDDDFEDYMRHVAADTSVVAIVGPTTSAAAEKMAVELGKRKAYNKPMITPSCTSVEYQRKYAQVPYVWNLAESDIAQLEVILSGVASLYNCQDIPLMLLCADDGGEEARNAYAEWFGFIAEEYGLTVSGVYLYKDEAELRAYAHEMCGTDWHLSTKVLVFNPSSPSMALAFDDEAGRIRDAVPANKYFYTPHVYCSDAFVSEQIARDVNNVTYEGVDLYASPESGFNKAYHQRFGRELINGEAQFYDALCLVAYAATLSQHATLSLNDAILAVIDGRDGKGSSWLPADMSLNFQKLYDGHTPDIDGVSSSWTFDERTHSTVTGSTFRRWRLYDSRFVTTEYVTTDGSRRSSSTKAMWDWTAMSMQNFNVDDESGLKYPDLDDRWALLIAASKGWANYRFQSDVFAMYQILRNHGYADDHIVLICEDDVARHTNNPHQGELRISDTGANVYDAAAIDYRLNTLMPDDIADILQGRASERLPHVLHPDADDDVFVFWSSHGSPGSMDFGGSQKMTYDRMRTILENTPHRKLLFAIEACYSGGLGEYCEGLPGCLFITAANPFETSHADVRSEDVGVFLSNGFTRGFQEAIDANPGITLRDLYYTIAAHTTGSHVKIYNAQHYGSVYNNAMTEFLCTTMK